MVVNQIPAPSGDSAVIAAAACAPSRSMDRSRSWRVRHRHRVPDVIVAAIYVSSCAARFRYRDTPSPSRAANHAWYRYPWFGAMTTATRLRKRTDQNAERLSTSGWPVSGWWSQKAPNRTFRCRHCWGCPI